MLTSLAGAGLAALMTIAPANAALPSPPVHDASVAWATPALWVVRDADTTIYLFGTFHTLDARTAWIDQRIRAAFDASNELVLETLIPSDPADVRAIGERQAIERRGPGGKPSLKPFVAETRAVVDQNRAMGLSVEHGADSVLRRLAEGSGKPVSGLETFEEQLATLANIPLAAPPPGSAVAASAAPAAMEVNDLLASWKSGNLAAYDNMLAGFSVQAPVAYRMLIADRNQRWGDWIEQRMTRPGTLFVAVGAGHVAGRDGLIRRLAGNGYSVTRVN
jgi:uncharacterized protein YbaP (TraB family)